MYIQEAMITMNHADGTFWPRDNDRNGPPCPTTATKPDLARDLFELQHRRPGLKRRRSPQNNKQLEPELRSELYGIADGRKRGNRPRIGIP